MTRIISVLFSLLVAPAVIADVQLRIEDARGAVSTISSNGRVARIDDAAGQQYVLIDFSRGQAKMVNPARGEVVVTRLGEAGGAASGAITLRLKERGGGPRIAGYDTRKLTFRANGEPCGTVYTSARLLKDPGIRALFGAMQDMQQMAQGMGARFGGMLNNCQRANLQLAGELERHGVPMRIVDGQGVKQSEVLSVDTDKRIDAGHYQVPAGLTPVDMDQQLDQAMQQAGEMMKNLPDMNQMMQQMQMQGGGMNEEMQQQMEKMQKMLQQMEQQQ